MTTEEKRKLLAKMVAGRKAKGEKEGNDRIEALGKSRYGLSSAQRGIWLDCQLDPDSAVYNIPFACKIKGSIDIEALRESLKRIIARHDMWRTVFRLEDGDVIQEIMPEADLDFTYIDLQGTEATDEKVAEEAKEFVKKRIDLERGPLVRFAIYQTYQDTYYFILSGHHIAYDGSSENIFCRELTREYSAVINGTGSGIETPEISYGDYAEHSLEESGSENFGAQVEYWKKELDGIEPVEFPTDYARPAIRLDKGGMIYFDIDEKIGRMVREYAVSHSSTVNVVLFAAMSCLLRSYSRSDSVVMGTTVANRENEQLENMIGCFVNNLVITAEITAGMSFDDVACRVREKLFGAYGNKDVPLEKLVEVINPPRDLSRTPFYEVGFNYNPRSRMDLSLEGCECEEFRLGDHLSLLDVNFQIHDDGNSLCGFVEYNSSIYSRETVRGILEHYKVLLRNLMERPTEKIGEIEFLSQEERELVLGRFNDTAADYPREKTIAELFEEQAERTPDNVAVVFEGEELTYRELNRRANSLAHRLRELGVGPDDFVAVIAERSLEMIEGILGVIKSGGAYVPIDPTFPEERIRYMLEDSRPKAVLTYRAETKIEADIPVIDLAEGRVWESAPENPERVNRPEDLVYCIYTSGTTGKPKGVMIEHRGVCNLAGFYINEHGVNAEDKVLAFANFVFDASVTEMVMGLLSGACLHVASAELRGDMTRLAEYISREGITIALLPPVVLAQFEVKGPRLVITAGSESSRRLIEQSRSIPVYSNDYGPTEGTVCATFWRYESGNPVPDRIPIGKPISNKKIYMMNGGSLCGIGVPGELCIAGDGLARGYLNRPELTAEKFTVNPFGEGRLYHTGDLARWLPDGNIEYLGRIDDQVKIRGFRVELGEIESRLRELDEVKDCAVIAREDASGEKAIYAYVVGDGEISVSRVRESLGKVLPEYMVPQYMMQIEAIPVTKNGKLDKRALPEIEASTVREYVAPRNSAEEAICRVFGEVLNVAQVGVKDSFFELGGHSLRATRLVNRIEAETGCRLALKQVFSSPTPEKLAELVTGSKAEEYTPIPRAEEREYYAMTSAQKRTFFICQMDPDGILYNMPQNYRLTGEVRPEGLRDALQRMIDRHEMLRTEFLMLDGEPVQRILEHAEADFTYIEDSETPETELTAGFIRPFDLGRAPLVRMRLVDRGGSWLLSLDMHHIVGDGMSIGTFLREFCALYNGEELPEARQFRDYSEWMRTRDLSTQGEYWKEQFSDEIPVLDMPLDHARPLEQSYSGAAEYISIGKELTEKIDALAAETGTTEFMVFLSAAMVLLGKYSRQEDIVIGTPISGRTHRDTEGMLGMFINTLAMRGKPEAGKSFREFLMEMKETSLRAYENQEYPFEELVEAINVRRDLSRSPLFDVMLVLQNNEDGELNLRGAAAEWAEQKDTVAKFDLTFDIEPAAEGFTVGLEYCTALFMKESAEGMLRHFVSVMVQATAEPDTRIGEIGTTDSEERELVLRRFNDTVADYPREKTLAELFEEQAERTPDNVAVVFEGEELTYRELNGRANSLAHRLRELGVGPDDFVAVIAERSLEMIEGILGVIKAGGAYVPIDPTYPEERIRYMLEDSRPKAFLTYRAETEIEADIPVIDLADGRVWEGAPKNPERVNRPENLVYCIYTSGTTGKPKGVMIEHRGACNLAMYLRNRLPITGDDHVMLFANYIFDGSVWEMLSAFMNGAALYIPTDETIQDIDAMKRYVSEMKISVSYFPPAYYEQGRFELGNYVLTAGSAASQAVVELALERSGYINAYGPTESTVCVSTWICQKGDRPGRVTIGKPIDNVQVYIMQGDSACGIGVPGELCAAGASIARGYLNLPELTAEKFTANPFGEGRLYHTGDLARWLPDGNIEYLGRIDEQVKIRGFRIELGEIESRLRELDEVKDCAVIAREDASGDKAIYAYVVGDGEISVSQVRESLGKVLPEYMVPQYMMQIEAIPVTKNGKLDKRALPEIEAKHEGEYREPVTDEEKALCEAFRAILGLARAGVGDSFFELGGDSIKAIRVVSHMRSQGYEVSVKEIMKRRTPEGIAPYVEKAAEETNEQGEVTGTVTGTPIMRQFLSWNLSRPEHFNQAVVIRLEDGADAATVGKALDVLTEHHDALRAVIRNGTMEILSCSESRRYELQEYDLRGESDAAEKAEELCTALQSGMDLAAGPLMKAALLTADEGRYLMICIHHYAVDGVSWRILLEDFGTAIGAIMAGNRVKLPAKTASYIEWSKALEEYRTSAELAEEKGYWDDMESRMAAGQLHLGDAEPGDRRNGRLSFELPEETTDMLLHRTSKAYNTQINDLLLAALGTAVKRLTGQDTVAVGLEGHGREPLHRPVNIDRTVGWFTSLYPVELRCTCDMEEAVAGTKDMLREVPNHGIGYGLLNGPVSADGLDVYFNYLGEMDSEGSASGDIPFGAGRTLAEENRLPGKFSLNAHVEGGRFACELTYNGCSNECAERFLGLYCSAVEEVTGWCASQKEPHVTESDMYALTPLQDGMYFYSRMDSGDTSYLLQTSFRVSRRINTQYLKVSLSCLAEKYEVLKTAIAEGRKGGSVKQYIDAGREPELIVKEYARRYGRDALEEYAAGDLARGFDILKDALMRVAVLSFEDCDVMLVSSHHIIVDGWCNPIVFSELARYYGLCEKGTGEEQLRRLARDEKRDVLPFQDYVGWIGRTKEQELKAFWDGYLEGYDTAAEIKPIGKPEESADVQVVEAEFSLDEATTGKLERLAKECGTTMSTVSQLAIGLLLRSHCRLDDVVIGNVVSGRNVPLKGIETAVGMFINTVPLRIQFGDGSASVREMLARLQESNSECSGYDHAPLAGMKAGSVNVSDYIKHLFVFENYPDMSEGAEVDGLGLEQISAREQTNYSLTFAAYIREGRLAFRLSYDPGIYTEGSIRLVGSHLERIAEQMAAEPSSEVRRIELLRGEERELVLRRFNDTAAEYPREKTIAELFEEQAERTPENVAVVFEGEELTYRELNRRANSLAHRLRELGVGPDDFVAVIAERSLEMIEGIYGVIKAGGAYVPIDPKYPEERKRYILEDSRPKAVLTYRAATEIEADIPVIDLADGKVWEGAPENPERVNGPEDLIYCIYTSGTTGKPKGVPNRNRGLINRITWMHGRYPLAEGDAILQKTTFTFDVSVWEIIWWSIVGARVVLLGVGQEKSPEDIRHAIGRYGVTHMHFVPSMLNMFLFDLETNGGIEELTSLKYVFSSGEALTTDQLRSFNKLIRSKNDGTRLINFYGPTEASIDVTYFDCEYDYTVLPIGRPINNTQIYIVQGASACGIGIPGELCIAGDGLARGYLNRPELTAEKFAPNLFGEGRMYHTGDLARWLPDGNIEYLGRIDDQVKIRGFRIELGEIASRLRELEEVKDCAVIVRNDSFGEKAMHAYVVSDEELDVSKIKESLGKMLPEYMVPQYMMQIEAIPVTRNGKLDRKALPEIVVKAGNGYVAPRNSMEETLCLIFGEVLNVERVGVTDNFFDLGGHSLRATRLVNRIEAETGIRIGLKLVFRNSTPEKLAKCLGDNTSEDTEGVLYELTKQGGKKKKINLICVPYGAAQAIVFKELADNLPEDIALYSIQVPGRDIKGGDGEPMPLSEFARICVTEIKDKVKGPIAVYGHCMGGALAMQIALLLREENLNLIGVFEAGTFPFPRLPGRFFELWNRVFNFDKFSSTKFLKEYIVSIGGKDAGNGEDQDAVSSEDQEKLLRNMRFDSREAEDFYTRILNYTPDFKKLSVPICCIMGERDRLTEFYQERYHEWEDFSDDVSLKVIPEAGHYFSKHQPDILAKCIVDQLEDWRKEKNEEQKPQKEAGAKVDSKNIRVKPSLKIMILVAIGQIISLLGSSMSSYALGIWVMGETVNISPFMNISIIMLLPAVLAAPFAGPIVDRFDRRKVMIISDCIAATGTILVSIMLFTGNVNIWFIYLSAVLAAFAGAFQRPAYLAAIAQITPKRYLDRVNGFIQLGEAAGTFIAPMLAGVLLMTIDIKGILIIDLATFIISTTVLLLVRFPNSLFQKQEESFAKAFVGGWKFIIKRKSMRLLLLFFLITNVFMSAAMFLYEPILLSFANASTLGVVLAAQSLGMMVAGLIISIWGGCESRAKGTVGFVILGGLAAVLFGLRPSALLTTVAMFICGMSLTLVNTHYQILIQSKVGMELQGRVFSINIMLASLLQPIAVYFAGVLSVSYFNPLMGEDRPANRFLQAIVGSGAGRGMALLCVILGLLQILWGFFGMRWKSLVNMDTILPDAAPGAVISGDKDKLQEAMDNSLNETQKQSKSA